MTSFNLQQYVSENVKKLTIWLATQQILDSLVVRISACHVEGPGSIPGRGGKLFVTDVASEHAEQTKNVIAPRGIEPIVFSHFVVTYKMAFRRNIVVQAQFTQHQDIVWVRKNRNKVKHFVTKCLQHHVFPGGHPSKY